MSKKFRVFLWLSKIGERKDFCINLKLFSQEIINILHFAHTTNDKALSNPADVLDQTRSLMKSNIKEQGFPLILQMLVLIGMISLRGENPSSSLKFYP